MLNKAKVFWVDTRLSPSRFLTIPCRWVPSGQLSRSKNRGRFESVASKKMLMLSRASQCPREGERRTVVEKKKAVRRYGGGLGRGVITKRILALIALMCCSYPRQWTGSPRSASVQGPISAGGLTQRKTIGQPFPPSPSSGAPGDALEPLAIRQSHEFLRSHRSHAHEKKSKRPRDAVRLRTIENA
jgi:hypothetical protein